MNTYDIITDRFISKIKEGVMPWQRPWQGGEAPQNMITRKPYHGINAMLLGLTRYSSPFWMSYKQAASLGGQVKKGEKSELVVYFRILEKKDKEGNTLFDAIGRPQGIPLLRYSNVFNLEQTEGIEPPPTVEKSEFYPLTEAEAIANQSDRLPKIQNTGDRACYIPTLDIVKMPSQQAFKNNACYYHTLFHELTHSTGHSARLNRKFGERFGDDLYSKEELIAELGAAFISNSIGLLKDVVFDNAASYVSTWLSKLQDDTKLIVSASSAAQRACEYILHSPSESAIEHSEASLAS